MKGNVLERKTPDLGEKKLYICKSSLDFGNALNIQFRVMN